ncbi:RNA methyltransferas-like protein [Halenospora varia]|nr:RNA methyltransferas-like protein [Halenospora varia]
MTSIVLTRNAAILRTSFLTSRSLYHAGKAASVNTGIARGLRKSKGVGFGGKPRAKREDGFDRDFTIHKGIKLVKTDRELAKKKPDPAGASGGGRHGGHGRGPRTLFDEAERPARGSFQRRDNAPSFERKDRDNYQSKDSYSKPSYRGRTQNSSPAFASEGTNKYPSLSAPGTYTKSSFLNKDWDRSAPSRYEPREQNNTRSSYGGSDRSLSSRFDSRQGRETRSFNNDSDSSSFSKYGSKQGWDAKPSNFDRQGPSKYNSQQKPLSRDSDRGSSGRYEGRPSSLKDSGRGSPSQYESREPGGTRPYERPYVRTPSINHTPVVMPQLMHSNSFDPRKMSRAEGLEKISEDAPMHTKPAKPFDNRIPISIPYTTPASEFLYGTSVVEAALMSKREPRRKLYKLYIYAGENRDKLNKDNDIEYVAKRKGIKISRVQEDGLRLMDKMSGGRPHNGYVLEASPLPKLPVTSLESLKSEGNETGFDVALDYQTREEAEINGESNFVSIPYDRSGRKPMVLLLDGIQDPGNLGGIIRTAAFLGVSAVAISTRNSASFSPVVLKASAGASESVTLFAVNKSDRFIQGSRLAGWKVFAAVAPSPGGKASTKPKKVSTDSLGDPLSHDPCILMLGSEGEGLRSNLRSKADVEVFIPGRGRRFNVDSLNVSVAAGILCNSFLSRSKTARVISDDTSHEEVAPEEMASEEVASEEEETEEDSKTESSPTSNDLF